MNARLKGVLRGAVGGVAGAVWAAADELVVPLLGLADRPTVVHATRHAPALIGHLGYGVATAAAAPAPGARRWLRRGRDPNGEQR